LPDALHVARMMASMSDLLVEIYGEPPTDRADGHNKRKSGIAWNGTRF